MFLGQNICGRRFLGIPLYRDPPEVKLANHVPYQKSWNPQVAYCKVLLDLLYSGFLLHTLSSSFIIIITATFQWCFLSSYVATWSWLRCIAIAGHDESWDNRPSHKGRDKTDRMLSPTMSTISVLQWLPSSIQNTIVMHFDDWHTAETKSVKHQIFGRWGATK